MGKFWRAAKLRTALLTATASVVCATPAFAQQQTQAFNIPAQNTASALTEFSRQAGVQILFPYEVASRTTSQALQGDFTRDEALRRLTQGTQLSITSNDGRTVVLADSSSPTQLGAADRGAEEEIVVTGTHIRGADAGASPLLTFNQETIERSGVGTVQDYVSTLPQNSGAGVSEYNLGPGDRAGGGAINLRGLGNDSTLVLINGRRPGAAGQQSQYVDLSLIPTTAVDRLDVLLDGSSAIYGSDAIAGVLNVVLRNDFDGAESRLRFGAASDGGEEVRAAQAVGRRWATGHLMGSYEYYDRQNVPGEGLDFVDPNLDRIDLVPHTTRHALFLSGDQQISDDFGVDFFSVSGARESEGVLSLISGPNFTVDASTSDVDQYVNSLRGVLSLGSTWTAELAATIGRNQASIETQRTTNSVPITTYYRDAENASDVLDFVASGRGPAGSRLAIGSQLRSEQFIASDTNNPALQTDLERDARSLFGEARIPLWRRDGQIDSAALELTLAARYDDYSDFGSTTNPKVGLSFEPIEGLRFTSTWGTSFKAPLFQELDMSGNQSLAFDAPDPAAADGASGVIVLFGGNGDLLPETSETFTLGVEFNRNSWNGLRAGVDYYRMDFTDRIASLDSQPVSFFQAFTRADFFAPVLNSNPTPSEVATAYQQAFQLVPQADVIAILDLRQKNISSTLAEGIDYHADVAFENGLSLGVQGNYVLNFDNRLSDSSPTLSSVATVFNTPRSRVRASVGWTDDRFDVFGYVNYTSTFRDTRFGGSERVEAWTTIDVSASMRFGELASGMGDRGVSLRVSAVNLFDEEPPFVRPLSAGTAVAFDGVNANPLGRMLSIELVKSW